MLSFRVIKRYQSGKPVLNEKGEVTYVSATGETGEELQELYHQATNVPGKTKLHADQKRSGIQTDQ